MLFQTRMTLLEHKIIFIHILKKTKSTIEVVLSCNLPIIFSVKTQKRGHFNAPGWCQGDCILNMQNEEWHLKAEMEVDYQFAHIKVSYGFRRLGISHLDFFVLFGGLEQHESE